MHLQENLLNTFEQKVPLPEVQKYLKEMETVKADNEIRKSLAKPSRKSNSNHGQ